MADRRNWYKESGGSNSPCRHGRQGKIQGGNAGSGVCEHNRQKVWWGLEGAIYVSMCRKKKVILQECGGSLM
jgi:hypothetical protein